MPTTGQTAPASVVTGTGKSSQAVLVVMTNVLRSTQRCHNYRLTLKSVELSCGLHGKNSCYSLRGVQLLQFPNPLSRSDVDAPNRHLLLVLLQPHPLKSHSVAQVMLAQGSPTTQETSDRVSQMRGSSSRKVSRCANMQHSKPSGYSGTPTAFSSQPWLSPWLGPVQLLQ